MGHRFSNGLPRFDRLPSLVFFVLLACWFSLIAVAVGRVCITLDCFVDLVAMNGHITRGCNADPNLLAFYASDSDADVVTDVDLLVYGSSEN
jgi:hypothetical protein